MIYFQHSSKHFSKNSAFSIIHTEKGTSLHFHSAVEFMYIVKGELNVTLNGTTYQAREGDLLTVNSAVVHSSKPTDKNIDYYILIANDEFFKSNGLYYENTRFTPLIHSEEVQKIFAEIINEYNGKDEYSNSAITAHALSLFIYLNRHHVENKGTASEVNDKKITAVKKTLDYISDNFKNKLTVDEISNALHFSKSYLSHVFKNVTGHSLIDYVNLLKCQTAKSLIKNGATIKQASFECGFSDVSYFTRTFKKVMGGLPSAIK